MAELLLIVQIVLSILITILVLLQKSESMGLGAYTSSNTSLFGAKGPMSFLTKATMFLGTLFILNTLTLVYIYNNKPTESVVNSVKTSIPNSPIPSLPKEK